MRKIEVVQKRLIKWFSGLPLEVMQHSNKKLSFLLKEVRGFKEKQGNQCMFSPCSKHQYSRGLCSGHYYKVNVLRKLTGADWKIFIQIGICTPTSLELRWAYEATNDVVPPKANDPLRVLIRKLPTNPTKEERPQ